MDPDKLLCEILNKVPQQSPFRFIDEITYVDENLIEGSYFLSPELDFYKGHFPGFPLTPGVILTEIMAQIGMVAFGIYLMMLEGETQFMDMAALLTETNIKFIKQVPPGQKIFVRSEKILFRHGRLRCNLSLKNSNSLVLCHGNMAGMLFVKGGNITNIEL